MNLHTILGIHTTAPDDVMRFASAWLAAHQGAYVLQYHTHSNVLEYRMENRSEWDWTLLDTRTREVWRGEHGYANINPNWGSILTILP